MQTILGMDENSSAWATTTNCLTFKYSLIGTNNWKSPRAGFYRSTRCACTIHLLHSEESLSTSICFCYRLSNCIARMLNLDPLICLGITKWPRLFSVRKWRRLMHGDISFYQSAHMHFLRLHFDFWVPQNLFVKT